MVARYRPSHPKRRKGFRYRDAAGQLEDKLASLARHRRHVVEELARIERFVDKHPELRGRVSPEDASPRPRLVVENQPAHDGTDQPRTRSG